MAVSHDKMYSGVTIIILTPQTPQCGGGPMGAQNYGINIFSLKI